MNYKQLNEYERAIINAYLSTGKSIRWIANFLKRSPSTISREIKRNGVDKDNGILANSRAVERRKNAKSINLEKYKKFLEYLYDNFDKKNYSIDVLVNIAKKEKLFKKIPSTQSVYNWVNSNLLRLKKYQLLRSSNIYKRRWRVQYNKIHKMYRVPIHMRPSYINNRAEVGHWEADSVTTSRSGVHIMTIVERKSRYAITLKVESFHMEKSYLALKNKILESNHIFKSITFDNGSEFNYMYKLKSQLGISVYYCHPYAPSERGTNEVWNGYLRRFFPKGTKFSTVSNQELQRVTELINKTPRKILDWSTPLEVLNI